MESHPLNLAHQQHRRADAHLLNNKYDEAMQCHHNAAELLLDAMKSTTSSVALESITLQHSYHLKQKDLIKVKKEQYARVKKAVENIKWLSRDPFANLQGNEYTRLQVAIYRAVNESSSLLNLLTTTKESNENGLLNTATKVDVTDGKKTEKSQETVVEELQILSQNLHSLVEQLVMQVEVLKDDNASLKERIAYLEKERVKYLNLPSTFDELWNPSAVSRPIGLLPTYAQKVPVSTTGTQPMNITPALGGPSKQLTFDLSALKDE